MLKGPIWASSSFMEIISASEYLGKHVTRTEEALFAILQISAPRQPVDASPFQWFRTSPRPFIETPKHFASSCASLVSCIPYFRRESSSGNKSSRTAAAVPCGRGVNLRRRFATHLTKTSRGVFLLELSLDDRGSTRDISRSNDTKLLQILSMILG